MKISEEILKRNITKFTAFDEEDNPSIPYKDALKAVQEAIQLAKNNESLHDVIKSYSEKNMDDAYDKGYNDGASAAANDIMNSL